MKRVYVDVGCNRGQYSLQWAKAHDIIVYAFEPNNELYLYLKNFESENFKVFDYAIGTQEGVAMFNIGVNDATSSLKNFDKNYTHHQMEKRINVNVIRLDTFCNQNNIDEIAHIKIDAQGSDLDVLKSLGDHIYKVNSLMVEAFINDDVDVYEGEVKERQVMEFMLPKGFELINRAVDGNYCDLYFQKKL